MRIASLVLLLTSCAVPQPEAGTFEVTPVERAGGTCGPGKLWVEQLDETSGGSGYLTRDGIDWFTRRNYDLSVPSGYAEQRGVYHQGGVSVEESTRVFCASEYDLVLRRIE